MAKDDIIGEVEGGAESLTKKQARLKIEQEILRIKQEQNVENKTAADYARDVLANEVEQKQNAAALAEEEAVRLQIEIDILKNTKDRTDQQNRQLETLQAALGTAKETLATQTKIADEAEREEKARKATANHADNLFKRMFGFMYSDTPETATASFLTDPANFVEEMKSQFGKLTDIKKVTTGIIDTTVQMTAKLNEEQDQAVVNFRRATGAGDGFDRTIIGLERSLFTAGVSSAEAGQAVQSLFLNVTDFTNQSVSQRKELARTVAVLNELGVTTESSSKNIQFAIKVLGQSTKQAAELQREMFNFAQDLGVSVEAMSSDFAAMGPQIAALGEDGVDAFYDLQVQAKNTGLAMSELLGIVAKFDKFDTAAQSVGSLNALLGGPYLNTLELVAETDPSKRFEILKDRIDEAGLSFDEMDYYQRKALASAMGLNEQQLALMMRGRLDLIKEPQKSAADIEALAAQTAKFNTMMDEVKQTMMMFAVSLKPFIDFIKMSLNLFQKLSFILNPLIAAFVAYKTVVSGIVIVQKAYAATTTILAAVKAKLGLATAAEGAAAAGATAPTLTLAAAEGTATVAGSGLALTFTALVAAALAFAYVLNVSAGSPGLITMLGILSVAFIGIAVAANVFGFSIAGVTPFLLAFAAAVMMVGVGIGLASAGIALMVTSLDKFGEGLASNMVMTAVAIADIVESINQLDTLKTVTLGATMVATAAAAPAAMLGAAVAGGVSASPAAAAGGDDGAPAPPINIHLTVELDGKAFAAAVNNVEITKNAGPGGRPSKLHKTIQDGLVKGMATGV